MVGFASDFEVEDEGVRDFVVALWEKLKKIADERALELRGEMIKVRAWNGVNTV